VGQEPQAALVIELDRLLAKQLVDIGVAAIGIGATFDDEGLQPGGGVAEGRTGPLNEAFEGFVRVAFEEGRALDRAQPGPDARRTRSSCQADFGSHCSGK
jgi:hypothetical protein